MDIMQKRIIFRTGKREYILGYQDNSGNYYDKNDYYYLLFNKSDIKKIAHLYRRIPQAVQDG